MSALLKSSSQHSPKPLSMYEALIPVCVRALNNCSGILRKAESYAEAKKIDPGVLIHARLYPDMFPLSRQVQIACDIAKGGAARLAGVDIPSFPDTENTFAQLQERIRKTIDFVESIAPEKIDGSEGKEISLKVGGNEMRFLGQPYLLTFVLPNVYFHISVAYSILRHNGVDVGKKDYLGS